METFAFIAMIVLAILLLILSLYLDNRREKLTWSGTLEDKKIEHYFYRENNTKVYIIDVRKDTGEKVTYSVNADMYHSIENGARLVKGSGNYLPIASED